MKCNNSIKQFFKTALVVLLPAFNLHAQERIVAYDFEQPLSFNDWWVDNDTIKLSQCTIGECNQLPGSKKCLRIQWGTVTANKPYIWFTDIKVDTFGNADTQQSWKRFKENAWLSFKMNTADADSVYLQFVVFTKDEKDKWGSHEMIGFKSSEWKAIKVKLSALSYDNWGKGNVASPDFNSIIPSRIEIGIRSAFANEKGNVDVRIDEIIISNDQP